MTSLHRRLAAASVLLVLASTAPAADLNAYLPEDSTFVVGLNVRDFLDAPLVKNHMAALLSKHGPDALAALLRDDDAPKTDEKSRELLGRLLGDEAACRKLLDEFESRVARVEFAANDEVDGRFFLALEGTFDPTEFQSGLAALEKCGWMGLEILRLKTGDREFFSCKLPSAAEVLYVARVDAHTIILSTAVADVERALHREINGPADVRKELADLAAKTDGRKPVWFVLAPRADPEGVKTASGGYTLANGVHFDLSVAARDESAAAELTKVVRRSLFILPAEALEDAAKLMNKTAMFSPLTNRLKAAEARGEKNVLHFDLTIPVDMLEGVMKALI